MIPIKFNSKNLILRGLLHFPTNYELGVLFLHGGGTSSSRRYSVFQNQTHRFGQSIASLALDFRGCGHSEGNFEDGSLNNRLLDAGSALKLFIQKSKLPESNIFVWGSSMGGHVACRLVQKHPHLAGVVLQSAAAYSLEAESLPLNSQFTRAISQENSWLNSPAFTSLIAFPGKILVIYSQNDTVVPLEIQQRYQKIAQAQGGQSVILPGGTHFLLNAKTSAEHAIINQILDLGYQFIKLYSKTTSKV